MKEVHILLVEDNEGDIVLTLEAFKDAKMDNTISIVRDGEEAIRFLKKQDKYANANRPDIILLDINLPKLNGKETLYFIKNAEEFKSIPVVMLTSSSQTRDIQDAYKSKANNYLVKPTDFAQYETVVNTIENLWLSLSKTSKKEIDDE